VLECKIERTRTEVCQFKDQFVWYGILPNGTEQMSFQQIPMKGDLEFVWSPTGRLSRYDIRGDREEFWEKGSNAMLVLFHKNVVFKPDSVRRIGDDLERSLLRSLASAMEVDRSKKNEDRWTTNKPLWAGRRYSSGVAATARYKWEKRPEEGDLVPFVWDGVVSESTDSSSAGGVSTKTRVVGTAWYNPFEGRVDRLEVESRTMSTTGPLVGHTRWIALSKVWEDGDSMKPRPMPTPALE